MFSQQDDEYMQAALAQAERAEQAGEVPVGAVLVYDNKIVAQSHNGPIRTKDPTAHAEIQALREGAKVLDNYRLPGAVLYVTLEPCLMCVGAMVHARIDKLIYGASDPKAGAIQSQCCALDFPFLNHQVHYQGGLLSDRSSALLSAFFRKRR